MEIINIKGEDSRKEDMINSIREIADENGMVIDRWNDEGSVSYNIRNKGFFGVIASGTSYVRPDPGAKSVEFLIRNKDLLGKVQMIGEILEQKGWKIIIKRDYIN